MKDEMQENELRALIIGPIFNLFFTIKQKFQYCSAEINLQERKSRTRIIKNLMQLFLQLALVTTPTPN